MPITQIKMPDGSVKSFNLPDGATKDQIEQFLNAQGGPFAGASASGSTPPQEGAVSRFAHGMGVPTSMAEVDALGKHFSPVDAIQSGDMAWPAGPVGIAARDMVKTIGGEAIDQAGQAFTAAKSGDAGGYLRHSLGAAVPILGPPAADGNIAGAAGRAVSLAAGPALEAVGGALESSAPATYGKVFGPRADPALVAKVVPKLIDERVRVSGPQALSDLAQERATAATPALNDAISKMPHPISRDAIIAKIQAAQGKQLNQVGGVGVPNGPDAPAMIAKLNEFADNIRANAVGNDIAPENARSLRQSYDGQPGVRGPYTGQSTLSTTEMQARKVVGDAIRGELNKDPSVAAANADVSGWLKAGKLADKAPANKPLVTPGEITRAATGGVASLFSGGTGAVIEASVAAPIVYRFMTSPIFRTTSAIFQSDMANLIKAGRLGEAAAMATQAERNADPNSLVRSALQEYGSPTP